MYKESNKGERLSPLFDIFGVFIVFKRIFNIHFSFYQKINTFARI